MGTCKILGTCVCNKQSDILRTTARILLWLWTNPDTRLLATVCDQTEKGPHESTGLVSMYLKAILDMPLRSRSVRSCESRFR